MPLKCLSPTGPLFSFDFDRAGFEQLRAEQATRRHLHFGCCDAVVGLRVSSTGRPHFYHMHGASVCQHESETEQHLRIKEAVACSARAAGWTADTEAYGTEYAGGESWTADVLASYRSSKVAFEVQLSPQTWAETIARQRRYKASGVRGLWFFASNGYDVCEDIPSFQIRPAEASPEAYEVRISPPRVFNEPGVHALREEWASLPEFVAGALGRRLHWAPVARTGCIDVMLRLKDALPCKCGTPVALPVGCVTAAPGCAGHHALVWSIMGRGIRTLGPRWLNAIVDHVNGTQEHVDKIARRERVDRYTYRYRCPACGEPFSDVPTPHPEQTLQVRAVPLSAIGSPQPESAEWGFVYRWWLESDLAGTHPTGPTWMVR